MGSAIILGDAADEIKNIQAGSIDLAFLDPDYNQWKGLVGRGFIDDVMKTLKPSGNMVCFTKQPFDMELRQALAPTFRREIIWSFSNGGAWVSNKMPLVSFQKIYWATASSDFFFNPRTGLPYSSATKSFKRSEKVFGGYKGEGKDFVMSEDGAWLRDHYHFNKPTAGQVFAKPLELVEILIRCFCPPDGTVLDPFVGSGVTGTISRKLGMDWIGFEIDESKVENFTTRGTDE